jgi:hypothetical protein
MIMRDVHIEFAFPADYEVEILKHRPMLIEEPRQIVYPKEVEEGDQGALIARIRPKQARSFVGIFALGFDSAKVIHAVLSTPHPHWMCAVSGGYGYLVKVTDPAQWLTVRSRPVVDVRAAGEARTLLFTDFQTVSGFTAGASEWQTGLLSWEGIRLEAIEGNELRGYGWDALRDAEVPFTIDIHTGTHSGGAIPTVTAGSQNRTT